jgi:hypothetical protein
MTAQSTATVTAAADTGIEGEVNREFLRYLVGRQITCSHTKTLLDVRKAVAVEVTDAETEQCAALQVTTAAAYDDSVAPIAADWAEVGGYTVTVYDGRVLFGGAE